MKATKPSSFHRRSCVTGSDTALYHKGGKSVLGAQQWLAKGIMKDILYLQDWYGETAKQLFDWFFNALFATFYCLFT